MSLPLTEALRAGRLRDKVILVHIPVADLITPMPPGNDFTDMPLQAEFTSSRAS